MRILLVDPYYLAGHSPPNWVLGQLEAALVRQGYSVAVSDFCPGTPFADMSAFELAERAFIRATAQMAGRCDAVYITTSFGIPQKPTPILGRVEALADAISQSAPGIPLIVGGAQVEYLGAEDINPYSVLSSSPVTAFVRDDTKMPRVLAALTNSTQFQHLQGVWTRNYQDSGGLKAFDPNRTGPVPAASELEHCTWDAWDLSKYPPYRAILTSLGCRYACSFCFESRQQFQTFDFAASVGRSLNGGRNLMAIEDSTILGAHGVRGLSTAIDTLESEIEFTCYALVSEVDQAPVETLRHFRKRGMASVILGIETPDSRTLKLYKKNVQPDRVRRVLAKLHDAGIATQGCLMLGIPEVSLEDTLYTLDYALDLDIDVRRWHIFQPSFVRQPERLRTPRPLSVERFAKIPVSMPDNLIPELFAGAELELFLEEHLLMRAIPYVTEIPDELDAFRYESGYTLKSLYARILSALRGTKTSFNEEDYYRVLTPDHEIYPAVIDSHHKERAV